MRRARPRTYRLRWRLPALAPVAAYIVFISLLIFGITGMAATVVERAAAPVAGLMALGGERAASTIITASAVLEGDEWVTNLRKTFQERERSSARQSKLGGDTAPPPQGVFGLPLSLPGSGNAGDDGGVDGRPATGDGARTHRTMCVRLCDGYFFPVSFATTSDRFDNDQRACERSCSSPAKLYVYRNPGQEPDDMVDLRGQPYKKLSTAFQFRRKLDLACKCNPHPWEQEATERHRGYAEVAAKTKTLRQAELEAKSTKPAKNFKKAQLPATSATAGPEQPAKRAEIKLQERPTPTVAILNTAATKPDAALSTAPSVPAPMMARARPPRPIAAAPAPEKLALASTGRMRLGAGPQGGGEAPRPVRNADWQQRVFAAR